MSTTIRKTHNLVQGSPEWLHFRAQHFGASEAGAMLGLSPKKSRAELMREKHTAIAKEFSSYVQEKVLDEGHRVEALARPILEQRLGEELYPVTMSFGRLSASCDGLNMVGSVAFEHKKYNEPMAAFMLQTSQVPPEHMPQCQQVLLVTGAERLIFVLSDGVPERFIQVEVLPDPEWFDRIAKGWALFEQDLATYTPPPEAAPAPTGRAPEQLPAVLVQLEGKVVASNLAAVKETAIAVFKGIRRELATDQDFADAAQTVKWCEDIEARLKAAKDQALAQASSIEEVFRSIDEIIAASKEARLDLTKLVDARKLAIREEIVAKARQALNDHIAAATKRAGLHIRLAPPDWAAAVKNRRTIETLQASVDAVLTAARLQADELADRIATNVASLEGEGHSWRFLFPDLVNVADKTVEDFANLLTARIAAHKQAEEERQERARVQREAEEARLKETQARIDRAAADAVAVLPAGTVVSAEAVEQAMADAVATGTGIFKGTSSGFVRVPPASVYQPAVSAPLFTGQDEPAAAPAPAAPAPAAPPRGKPTIKLGMLSESLGFAVTAEFLERLGFKAAAIERSAKLYHAEDFDAICLALIEHIKRAHLIPF